jgi:hypothetical protein
MAIYIYIYISLSKLPTLSKKQRRVGEEKARSERSLRPSYVGLGTVTSITNPPAIIVPPSVTLALSIPYRVVSLNLSLSLYLCCEDVINTL